MSVVVAAELEVVVEAGELEIVVEAWDDTALSVGSLVVPG